MSRAGLARLTARYLDGDPHAALDAPGTLALFGFGDQARWGADPRCLRIPLQSLSSVTPYEHWQVDAPVTFGDEGALRWSAGGGWLFAAIELQEADHGGIEATAESAYRALCGFVGARAEQHLLRVWNYLYAINEGSGDEERYRRFCNGRARGLIARGIDRYPAATAIGHRSESGLLQVYALCASQPGSALENPRQVSAWRYPRQYGPTPPSFARAMRLPNGDLAISGTAAIVGHTSCHELDLDAQIDETFANLQALLDAASLPPFDADSPLKIYLRREADLPALQSALATRLAREVPRVILASDICRRELLVEIDGFRPA